MFVINKTKKSILTEMVNQKQNVLITGATGTGKTTLAIEIAEELNLEPVVINCGSTQDARSSLIGYFTLDNGSTKFQEADFLKAIQKPNTLVILDELSRGSADAYNIIFPILDFRQNIRVDEKDDNRIVNVAKGVRFMATANVGLEYSSTRSIDRALQDRFAIFNLEYIKGRSLKTYIKKTISSEVADRCGDLLKLYDYSHKMFDQAKLSTRISTRAVLMVAELTKTFELKDILDNVILSMFKQDSSNILNDANILREYADSLGVYKTSTDKAEN